MKVLADAVQDFYVFFNHIPLILVFVYPFCTNSASTFSLKSP